MNIDEIFQKQKLHAPKLRQSRASDRIQDLKKLREAILTRKGEIADAIYKDFGKSAAEVDLTEIFPAVSEINHTIRKLKCWMRPHRASTPMTMMGTSSRIHYEPKGVVLIIAPWNYPFSMLINPLIAAISAGNTAVLKPSEVTTNTSHFMTDFISKIFSPNQVAVVEGGITETQKLLSLPFDHIFFTGSTKIGRIVAEAAAKNLTPTTLELGGKSPVVIDDHFSIDDAASKIMWGKLVNGGQTCVAPDYVLVPRKRLEEFINGANHAIASMYGPSENLEKNSDYCRIVNSGHFQRLHELLEDSKKLGAKVRVGGKTNSATRFIAPTLLTEVPENSKIMKEEIFGPLLPVISYESREELEKILAKHAQPLAMYIFSNRPEFISTLQESHTSGGLCINNTLIHLANPNLPFGGVGPSGSGNYHGFHGFRTFSHERAVLKQGFYNSIKMFFPPYTDWVKKVMGWTLKYLT